MPAAEANPPLVVGIDGSEAALVALDWAAAEAAASGWPLRLVNGYEEPPIVPMLVAKSAEEAAQEILREARTRLVARGHGDLDVSMIARHGFPRGVLLHEAAGARALVVGRAGAGRVKELVLGSTSLACATHAKVPVVVVPATWWPTEAEQRIVVVGVDGSPRCKAAIEFAFEAASRWKARLVAVVAVRAHPASAGSPSLDQFDESKASDMLADQLSGARARFPEVEVNEAVLPGSPGDVLVDQAEGADLVVVGGRGHGVVTGALLGSVAQAVLHRVNRPIAVVHQP
ncbi:MAG TPA: universal stress protein [Jiangellales bacterium]|nr:universal stress protein [Jiangellales bacterium]